MKRYDYLIVGAGLFGSVFAHELMLKGYRCLVIDKRKHIGGNCYTDDIEGINVHVYGPHIFHTDNVEVWEYVNMFASFNHFVNRPKVNYKGKMYSFPINLMTLYQLWGTRTPHEAEKRLQEERVPIVGGPKNLEEWALSQIGKELYEIFIKGYTKKQWQRDPRELPSSIIKRLPIRLNFDDNYFIDKYQGIPIGGYTPMIKKMLDGIELRLCTDYCEAKSYWDGVADNIVYSGRIDELFGFEFGELEYRSLEFDVQLYENVNDMQGNAIVNYTEEEVPYTRVIEAKHFEFAKTSHTVITKEYPVECSTNRLPYYPVNGWINNARYKKYKDMAKTQDRLIIGGRLGEYRYYDMDDVIASALDGARTEIGKRGKVSYMYH